jgi:sec-independent protein translocase protein TatA
LNVGPLEIALVLLIVLVIFGPKRLPQLGRSLGGGMREFKDAVTGRDDERPPRLPEAPEDEERVAEPTAPRERDTVS